jgi:hypothetical protein
VRVSAVRWSAEEECWQLSGLAEVVEALRSPFCEKRTGGLRSVALVADNFDGIEPTG